MQQSARLRVRAGDPEVFRELFAEHARSVYNHAFRLTGTWSAAEEVVSLTYLEAWRLRGTVDADADGAADAGVGSLRPWLLGIATNVARNLRRAARRHQDALARLPRPEPVPDLAEEVTARIDDRERLDRVRVALAALRQPEREVLALCVWAGLDYAEAAAALGVPVGTVRSRLSRARARLARLVAAGKLREPPAGGGQMKGGRGTAALLAQEKAR
ncbi:RNA polymerase sigma factor [Dactylosporangium sp. AC04546]|uniref:RNA polymerase sigma factor n=1 Tax=Dactylosporangium sp. AC04546 TaxID=2862460 RepID=UPI001EDCA872|nr:RNA polymerase sigma factor [Dactylosporangium sp. AC04546]WVK81159.1 RNA polymerase sigma factor [Dactylosporangium sp. AC04546]